MTREPIIRLASKDDHRTLSRLFHAVEVHYWGPAAPSAAVARHVKDTVLASTCEMAIAELDGDAVGLATFAALYPAPNLGGQIFVKDIFVMEPARGRGVGRAMIAYLARLAVARGCVRLDWTAETSNPAALAAYDGLGIKRVAEKVYYRIDGEDLQSWATSSQGR